jgi:hypothetical protein
LGKELEKPGAGSVMLVEQRLILKQGLKHGPDIGVARRLISRQRTGITAQQRQVFGNKL